MPEATGTIQQVWEKKKDGSLMVTAKGHPYRAVKINGDRYSIYDTKLFPLLVKDSVITFTYEVNGDYKNITALAAGGSESKTEAGAGTASSAAPQASTGNGGGGRDAVTQEVICRQTCIKAAAEIVGPQTLPLESSEKWKEAAGELVIALAKQFLVFCMEPLEKAERQQALSQIKHIYGRMQVFVKAQVMDQIPDDLPDKKASIAEIKDWVARESALMPAREKELENKRKQEEAAATGDPWADQ